MHLVTSEIHGIQAVPEEARHIYSPGISTAGTAELRIAQELPNCHITATTIGKNEVAFSEKIFAAHGLANQITVKLEDIREPLPYSDNHFDFAYARLILHYLSRQALVSALDELHRTLKPERQLYIVVRSQACPDFHSPTARHESETGITTYQAPMPHNPSVNIPVRRYFHTQESITHFVEKAGFTVDHIAQYDEQLYVDFERSQLAPTVDNLIELLATK